MRKRVLGILLVGTLAAWGQNRPASPAQTVDHATAYYHFALAHMYAELAASYGNRGEYVARAIENYKAAIKADPKAPEIGEELTEFYIASGRLREAQTDAEEVLRTNPSDLNALRLLARIFTRQIGDGQGPRNRIDETMLRRAIDQYEKIAAVEPKDIDAWLMLGRLRKVSQETVDSEKAYKKALEIEPNNEDALTGLALIYSDRGDNKAAAEIMKKLAATNPSARSFQALAAAYEQMRDFGAAADALDQALALNPQNASELKQALAQDLVSAGRFDRALNVYKDVVADDPSNTNAFLRMSQIYRRQKDFVHAREMSSKALSLDPGNVEIRFNDVAILEAEGKPQDAIQVLKDILSSTEKRFYSQSERANRVALLEQLGGMYRNADQVDLAVAAYRQMAELDADLGSRVAAEIVETYRQGHQFTKARQEAEAAHKKWPQDRVVTLVYASVLADLGDVDVAVGEVKKLLSGPNDRDIYITLAQLYEKGRRFYEMAKSIDDAEKLSSSDDEKQGIWFMRGAMFEKMKRVEPAEKEFRKVLAADPGNAGALNYLGYMLADRNLRLPEALELIRKALEKEPDSGAYLDSLGWVYFRMGRYAEAEEQLRLAVEKTPKDPTVHDHLAETLMKQSKVKEAISHWELSLREWESSAPAEIEPADVASVKSKLESAKVRLAREAK